MGADVPRSIEGNTPMHDNFLPLPTHPRRNLHGHLWTNQDTYQQQYEVFLEQEHSQTTQQEDLENRPLQHRYHCIKRETLRELTLYLRL
jgi:hypothetical protein